LGKNKKQKSIRFWPVKILIIALVLTAGISVVTELLMDKLSIIAAALIVLFIMLLGVIFDLIGIAFATCDQKPFVSMASKKIKRAKSAISLLQNADIVSNICGDVAGDICGIVSGAAGAAIAFKIALAGGVDDFIPAIAVSSVIAALTISGKSIGKTIGLRKNKEIVSFVSYLLMFFMREDKKSG
jgi:CBS domain containing-hemolysin-like protein